MLKAFDETTKKEIKIGDEITDFRGEKSILINITRERTYKSGKVIAQSIKNGFSCEYYDKVFNLIVKDVKE